MKFALLMSAAFLWLTGAMWVFVFIALFWGCITIERALLCFLKRGGTS